MTSGAAYAAFQEEDLGMLAVGTVMLGGWAREASRPRFVDRYSHYDSIYRPDERQPYLMVDVEPGTIPQAPAKKQEAGAGQDKEKRYRLRANSMNPVPHCAWKPL